jgi:acetyl esterase/lipase
VQLWDEELESYREEARALLRYLPDLRAEAASAPSDPVARAEQMRASMQTLLPAAPSEMAQERSIPGPAGDVPVRVFVPEERPRALFLHLHGGGWLLGEPVMNDPMNEHLARDLGIAVVSVDYRLAPEHPYPAGPDDCQAGAQWLLEHGAAEFGADRLLIGGESAGGHLTLVTALRVRDRLGAAQRLLGLNLVFGWYDVNGTPSQYGNGGHPDMLDPEGLRFMAECFTPGMSHEQRRHPDVSPLYADFTGLPPCLVSVGTLDHLLDDSLLLAPRLAVSGVPVDLAVYPDSPHGFMAMPGRMAQAHANRLDAWILAQLERAGL